ncbi:MAG: hypothetical protein CMJ32_08480 [Phycisphaerae bacterium]|nr:hypothetical protein [Phycisphaerae bacterium]
MEQPRAVLYPSGDRIVTLQAVDGRAYVPQRALESGTMTGDVVIRLFRPSQGRRIDINNDKPAMVINADEAQFDQVRGEIRCDRAVSVDTAEVHFEGVGLTLLLDEQGDGIEQLFVDRSTAPIRINRVQEQVARPTQDVAPASDPSTDIPPTRAAATSPSTTPPARPTSKAAGTPTPKPAPPAVASKPVTKEPAADPGFYKLTLNDDVQIVRTIGSERSMISGDTLVAVFSLESDSLGSQMAGLTGGRFDRVVPRTLHAGGHVLAASASTVIAGQAMTPEAELIEISYSGRLVLLPVPTEDQVPPTKDDVIIRIDGQIVTLVDEPSSARATCSRVIYRSAQDEVELIGSSGTPLIVDSPQMQLQADRFWLRRPDGKGGLEGPGWMELEQESSGDDPAVASGSLDTSMVVACNGSSEALGSIVSRMFLQDSDSLTQRNLQITWTGGVDLEFAPGQQDSRLRSAQFNKDVHVDSDDFLLDSESLKVVFSTERTEQIEQITAAGKVDIQRLGERGVMRAEFLQMDLAESEQGKAIPSRLQATGDVMASDPQQTMWTQSLDVTFRPRPLEQAAPAEDSAQGEQDPFGDGGNVQIETVEATEKVQVLLSEGARVFADSMKGNAIESNLELKGDVLIIQDNIVADQIQHVVFDDKRQSAHADGPGRFRYFDQVVSPNSKGPIPRPELDEIPALKASWTRSMHYDNTANDGGGSIDLAGGVQVRSRPSATEADLLDGDSLTLDLADKAVPAGTRADPEVKAQDGEQAGDLPVDSMMTGSKRIRKLTARGDARLQSQAWPDPKRTGEPRLFRVLGQHVEYDTDTGEASVIGSGGLLVHDVGDGEKSEAVVGSFASEGTTRFRWSQGMRMERQVGRRYLIVMQDDIEVLHAGLVPDDTLTMTADRLDVTVERELPAQGESEDESSSQQQQEGFELGETSKILRVRGVGRVFIRTPKQDIECHEFDYNVDTQIATLRARPGRTVTVLMRDAAGPIHSESVLWDMRSGRIRITGGGGTIGR